MLDKFFSAIERFVPVKWRWVLGHGGFRRYFANTGWMFFGQMFGLCLSFFIGVWVIRYLGPENYGVLSYALAFAGIFSFIAGLGVDNILNRELVKFPEKRDELMGTAFRLKLIGGFIAFAITVISVFIINPSTLIKFLVMIYSFTFIFQSLNIVSTFFQSRVEAKKNVRAQVLSSSLTSILKIIMILSGLGVIWIMIAYTLDSLWLVIILLISYRRSSLKFRKWKFSGETARQILSSSWLMMLTTASVLIYMKIDQVIIRQMLDERAVGLYSAAIKLSEIWYFIPGIICVSLFPAIINSKKTDQKLYYSRLKRLYILVLVLSIIIAIIVSALAKPIIYLLFGSDYLESISVLRIYAWSTIGFFLGMVSSYYLLAENYMKIYFSSSFFVAVLNIVLNVLLIPKFGINGAAIATVVSYSFLFLVLLFFRKTRRDISLIFVK